MSDRNPFRSPASSKAEGVAVPRRPSPPLPPLPPPSPTSGPSSQSEISTSSSPPDASSGLTIAEIIEDDLPPPYTPTANVGMGEETIGLGPRRPFQRPPPLPSSSLNPPSELRSHSNWLPPGSQPFPAGPGPSSGYRIQPDPRTGPAPWQTQQQYRQRQNGGGGLLGALIDTVRDIADSVSGVHDEQMMVSQRANAAAYTAPYSSTGTVYTPPPGPPGQVHQSHPPRPASTPPRTPSSMIPDDGSPTRTPVPGHPLLRNGNLLVYPKDHLCVKCKNTGYKNYDPSHPCRKCWEKYGKPYTGALSYTPWSSSGNDPRMQRALPKFVPPHLAGLSSSGSGPRSGPYPPPPQHPYHSRSVSQPYHGGSGPSYYVLSPFSSDMTPPVPHAIPVSPGDPRLGGRLCTRCHGAGYRTVMLIDVTTCENCGGTGRVWM